MAQTLKFGNGTWATKKGSTLAFNDEDGNYKPLPFATTRSTSATRVNKEGLIEVVEGDRPRIDYTDSADGVLLLEPQRTNLITYSNDFSNSFWGKTKGGVGVVPVVTSNYATSPDGTQNADRIIFDIGTSTSSSDISQLQASSIVMSGDYTNSLYLKSNTGTEYDMTLLEPDGSAISITITSVWQRFTTADTVNATDIPIKLRLRGNESTSKYADISIYGAQLEVGSLSSYIPTQGSAVTRVAETASGSGNSEVFNDSEGVLFANIAALADDETFRYISISDGTSSNTIRLYYTTTSNSVTYQVRFNGALQVLNQVSMSDITNYSKIAVKWKLNNFSMFINGLEVATDTSGNTPIGLNSLQFADANGETSSFYGKTKEIAYYNTVLTDAELETLTSYRSLSELVTELNLNTL